MLGLLEIVEPFLLKHIVMNSYHLYCILNSICCSESKYISECKVIQPLVITSLQCDLAFYRVVCSLFQNDSEIVPLAQMGFTGIPIAFVCGLLLLRGFRAFCLGRMELFPFVICLFLPSLHLL